MPGRLTTHILDTARGRPASNVAIELWRVDDGAAAQAPLRAARTNADGRTDAPLLQGEDLTPGVYELVFNIGDYFQDAAEEGSMPTPPFLDRVPVRFGIADPDTHYHVPLLASPWAYSTYRGS